jgi:hypothetical protein
MGARSAAMTQPPGELARFVGEWTMTAGPPDGPRWPGEGHVSFAWTGDGAFLAQRWRIEGSNLPEGMPTRGTALFGHDEAHGTYVQLYYDNRGVYRVYQMTLHDDEWTMERASPPFAQRFRATFGPDGRTIAGRWEIREPGDKWRVDFDVTYTRVG